VNCQVYLAKSSIANFLDKLVEIKASWREFTIVLNELFVILYYFVSFFHYFFVQFLLLAVLKMLLFHMD
jgi:hypothetical protein